MKITLTAYISKGFTIIVFVKKNNNNINIYNTKCRPSRDLEGLLLDYYMLLNKCLRARAASLALRPSSQP